MDISKITDVTQLKALAFDQIGALEQAQANIRALNARIAEVQETQDKIKPEEVAKKN